MTNIENFEHSTHENGESGRLPRIDPTELLRHNPAAAILNRDTYRRMEGRFDPNLFEPVQVARVASYIAGHVRVVKPMVVDGLTRARYATEHKGIVFPQAPDFSFDVIEYRDVTDSYLSNPEIVSITDRREDQDALEMEHYLKAVIPATVAHADIAPDRIAAHLINGWESMVGAELSEKYSALAAISFLTDERINISTEANLRRDLSKQEKFIAGETDEERMLLQEKLLKMGAIIQESRLLHKSQVQQAAFDLVSSASDVIGGERETSR